MSEGNPASEGNQAEALVLHQRRNNLVQKLSPGPEKGVSRE
jgi:hypothetical protein